MVTGRATVSESVRVVLVEAFALVKTNVSPDATGPEPPLEYVQFVAVAKSVLPAEPFHVSVSAKARGLKPNWAKSTTKAAAPRKATLGAMRHALRDNVFASANGRAAKSSGRRTEFDRDDFADGESRGWAGNDPDAPGLVGFSQRFGILFMETGLWLGKLKRASSHDITLIALSA
jgi:hypothetical protein